MPMAQVGDDDVEEPINSQEANNGIANSHFVASIPFLASQWNSVTPEFADELFKDTVHTAFSLPPICRRVFGTAQFQRLGWLRQLGKAHTAFTAAQHTRLEHSLGVAYLTQRQLWSLLSSQGAEPELEVEERDVRNLVLAGLCHDLGHGPLSHVFEKEFLRISGVHDWEHEAMSVRVLEHLVDDNGIEDIEADDIRFIESAIRGRRLGGRPAFLFDIVSNDRNGVDTDRMDYLRRDALHCGVTDLGADTEALLRGAKVVDGQVCYPLSQAANVWAVYADRTRMFREVYTARRVKAAEFMASEALVAAEPVLRLTELIHEPEDFVTLNDSVLSEVETFARRRPAAFRALEPEAQAGLVRAREVLLRLHRGDLYPCCGEVAVPDVLTADGSWEAKHRHHFSSEAVAAFGECERVRAELAAQLVVFENRIDAGKGGKDPMEAVGFFDDSDASGGSALRHLSGEELAALGRPACLQERTLRVFVRSSSLCDAELRRAAARALAAWCRAHIDPDTTEADVMRWRERGAVAPAVPPPQLQARQDAAQAAGPRCAAAAEAPQLPLAPCTPAGPGGGSGGGAPAAVRCKRRRPDDNDMLGG